MGAQNGVFWVGAKKFMLQKFRSSSWDGTMGSRHSPEAVATVEVDDSLVEFHFWRHSMVVDLKPSDWTLRCEQLSGPVLRDTARLSQRYPPIAR